MEEIEGASGLKIVRLNLIVGFRSCAGRMFNARIDELFFSQNKYS